MNKIILATSNAGKIKEFNALLHPVSCISQQELGIGDAEETGLSFIENAIIKARHASSIGKQAALADDSGIVVPALQGAPGIYSARFAGNNATSQDNIELLLQKLSDFPKPQRQAYFYCAIALVRHSTDPTPLITTGIWHGEVTNEPQGETGFGYDPIFYIKEHQCTAAQLPSEVKNTISHRAIALRKLQELLQSESI